jgi:putative oxidoreductase
MKDAHAAWGLAVIRIVLGVIFLAHGGQKVLGVWGGQGLEATVAGMAKGGIPAIGAYAAAFTEFLGGIGLIVGVLSRFWGVGLAITMLVAMIKVHGPNGFFLQASGYEYNLALLAMSVAIVIGGPGKLALNDFEGRFLGAKSKKS